MSHFAIQIRGLINQFGSQVVHDRLDLDLPRGQIIGVVGGSGSGKSVLMRAILGLRAAQGGSIEVLGRPVTGLPDRDAHLRQSSGVLFQDGALFSSLTVAENVEVVLRAHCNNLSPVLRRRLAVLKVKLVGLPTEAADKYPAQLSGGMRKRAGLARALALDPELLFLDEPTAGLDPIGAADFDSLLKTLQRSLGLTVFLITHDLDTLYSICDQIAVLGEKRILTVAPLDQVEQYDHPWVQEYFHGARARAARK